MSPIAPDHNVSWPSPERESLFQRWIDPLTASQSLLPQTLRIACDFEDQTAGKIAPGSETLEQVEPDRIGPREVGTQWDQHGSIWIRIQPILLPKICRLQTNL